MARGVARVEQNGNRTRAEPARSPAHGVARGVTLAMSPSGRFHLEPHADADAKPIPEQMAARIERAFVNDAATGLIHLASVELESELPPSLAFGRELARRFFVALCRVPELEAKRAELSVPIEPGEIAELARAVPPMVGAEYVSEQTLADAWRSLEVTVARELGAFRGSASDYLRGKGAAYGVMGRVCLHLAENRANEDAPFAFLATYALQLSGAGRVQHAPLGRALKEYAGAAKKADLLRLLEPVRAAAEGSAFLRALVDSGEIFHPLAWTPKEAYAFLQDAPAFEASGVVVRVPDWWRARRAARPQVSVTIGKKPAAGLGTEALLDFSVTLSLDGEPMSASEWQALLAGSDGLQLLRGRWVEVDRERLREVLEHWKRVDAQAASDGISFLDGMRMLAGVEAAVGGDAAAPDEAVWSEVKAGPWLEQMLAELRDPAASHEADPGDELLGTLRPYQREGVAWLLLLARLGLGACLADDMGLGKTIQVLALLLLLRRSGQSGPHLLVVPASLLGNWKAEIARFAPSLRVRVAHPSANGASTEGDLESVDMVMTTYGALQRQPWMLETRWGLVVLDEAQAIKNPKAKQTRAVKGLRSRLRLALTGTPVENQLGDLWSLFDFLCPGLLGSDKAFHAYAKRIAAATPPDYGPLRSLIRPYILRRMKTDRRIISDLPDKTEVRAFCGLGKVQAALYQNVVDDLAADLESAAGMRRRGLVLASLLRLKQICNHPSQLLGDGAYAEKDSGKLGRLRELCEAIAAKQERVLVFTQFREMTDPLARLLADIFGRPGLVLHGDTRVGARSELVAEFQRDDGPPFFVLSLKAGGTGLNLTAASHVIHFDRWWNPAVENQATDRAYRIGQNKNVLVHKFVCRGTVEEKIDALLEAKRDLSEQLLVGGGEAWLTELPSDELLRLVSLDLHAAAETV